MAVYFDYKCEVPSSSFCVGMAWHKVESLVAVATSNDAGSERSGAMYLFKEEGEMVEHATIQRSCPPVSLDWHPIRSLITVGWENGEVVFWNEKERESGWTEHIHKVEVSILKWSPNGSRLVTGDKNGMLILWKADARGRLQPSPVSQNTYQQSHTVCVFKPGTTAEISADTAALARAAVSGDESALDMFSWNKGGKGNLKLPGNEVQMCFIGGSEGKLYCLEEKGSCHQVASVEGSIHRLLYSEHRDVLVAVTTNLMLTQFNVAPNGALQEVSNVKLSGQPGDFSVAWSGKGLFSLATKETLVRMWDLEKDDVYALSLDTHMGYDPGECINSIDFSQSTGVLAGGTNLGRVAMWKYSPQAGKGQQDGEAKWKLLPPAACEGQIAQVRWGSAKSLLAVNNSADVTILSQQVLSFHYNYQVSAVQTSPSSLSVDMFTSNTHHDLKADIHIKGVYTTAENTVVWNGKRAIVYDISGASPAQTGSFKTSSPLITLHEQSLYTIEPGKIQVRTLQGTVKQLLNLTDLEGDVVTMDIMGACLVVGTSLGFLKTYNISRREAKQGSNPKCLAEIVPNFGSILSAKCNANGTQVAAIVSKANGETDPLLYMWDTELDAISTFNFMTGRGDQDDLTPPSTGDEITDVERGRSEAARDMSGRLPISLFWDPEEPRLLCCEAKLAPTLQEPVATNKKGGGGGAHSNAPAAAAATAKAPVEMMMVTLFSTQEHGVLLQDSLALPTKFTMLLALQVPYFYMIKKQGEKFEEEVQGELSPGTVVSRQVMRDFVGLEKGDKNSRDAMMNFSYFLTIGNMDEAFKAIKLIKSETVWENMAKMCVKTRRLDVARVCLGNMHHARGAMALREAEEKELQLDAKVAALALQLGLPEDAERLYKNCECFDLLNQFYQASGQWSLAMETAETNDRIHLRTTYYQYAKHLEGKGDENGAIPNYEKSDTHRFEIPRMLFDEPDALEAYITKSKDKALRKWWAQYMESMNDMERALQFYEASQDYLSLVRVYCYCDRMDKAAEIANTTGNKAACYHLARQYENQENIKEAIHFFTRAQAYSQAIRLCKENGMEDQLMNLALLSSSQDQLEAARFYEQNAGTQDKAVMLYHKGGYFSKALELAFRTQQFSALQLIAEDLDEKTDPALLNKCATFFMEHGQFDKAVDLLVVGKKYFEALELCMEHNVAISEKLAEKMTVAKDTEGIDNEMRLKLLESVADCCFKQGSYHLATKKYTQAGNKIKAMRSLLKSGDTEKIVFFAGVSRQKEIYIMAANYLQSLDWRKDPEIMKNIISFYTKGRALDSLSSFYDACAQVEIDEYQNYDKALGALNEAYKCLTKAKMKNLSQQEEKINSIKARVGLVKKFVQARRMLDEDAAEAMKQCQLLLEEEEIDSAVRIGDIYGLMIEHYARNQSYKQAYAYMEDMRTRLPSVNMAYYVNLHTIETVHRSLDIPLGRGMGGSENKVNNREGMPEEEDAEDDDEVQEEIYNGEDGYC